MRCARLERALPRICGAGSRPMSGLERSQRAFGNSSPNGGPRYYGLWSLAIEMCLLAAPCERWLCQQLNAKLSSRCSFHISCSSFADCRSPLRAHTDKTASAWPNRSSAQAEWICRRTLCPLAQRQRRGSMSKGGAPTKLSVRQASSIDGQQQRCV